MRALACFRSRIGEHTVPELPEVETTRRGLMPHLLGKTLRHIVVRNPRLRWPVPEDLGKRMSGQPVTGLERRGKYLLLGLPKGTVMLHLGMSGSLSLVDSKIPPGKHDHIDMVLDSGLNLRFNDPRRFGAVLWVEGDPAEHALLRHLGPEPLGEEFDGDYLYHISRKRKQAVKSFLMDSQVVVGVGNIYANEALFMGGIRPGSQAGRISRLRYGLLAQAVIKVLESAIEQGGTTLRDFVGGDGRPGYFKQSLQVYGRGGLPCLNCGAALKEVRLSNRSTVYCVQCQR